MTTNEEEAAERARRFRLVADEIERILKDPKHPKYEAAQQWWDRLFGAEITEPSRSAYPQTALSIIGGVYHSNGGGQAWHDDLALEGWVD
jgi:hypothetical protein